jgi:hypothetical protein
MSNRAKQTFLALLILGGATQTEPNGWFILGCGVLITGVLLHLFYSPVRSVTVAEEGVKLATQCASDPR